MSRDQLTAFCHWCMQDANAAGARSPTALARAFVDFFGLAGFPRLATITELLQRAGVGTAVSAHLPDGLRGLHIGMGSGGYLIQYQAAEWPGAQEHTVLHETYEIIRERLHELYPRTGLPRGRRLCREADSFAAAVLMQPAPFACFAERTGFDVVALQRLYQRSYASLALRLAEVMQHQPLLTLLYERHAHGALHQWAPAPMAEALRASVVAPTPSFSRRTPRSERLPQRGRPPARGSVAGRVVQTGQPIYVERVNGCALAYPDDLTVAARPVTWQGKLAKVVLVAVPYQDRSVLLPQLGQASFLRLPTAHEVV